MEIRPLHTLPRSAVEQLLMAIPFFRTIKESDPWQFDLLLGHSRVLVFAPGETVLARGDKDSWLYFLLKGQLAVYTQDERESKIINYITPGEVFGDISTLVGSPRTATVKADTNCKQVMVFGTDFQIFGELENTTVINLATKLNFYRNTAHSLRWKLEVYRSRHPNHRLANEHRKIRLYTGSKQTRSELQALYEQSQALATLLIEWNDEIGLVTVREGANIDQTLLSAIQ